MNWQRFAVWFWAMAMFGSIMVASRAHTVWGEGIYWACATINMVTLLDRHADLRDEQRTRR